MSTRTFWLSIASLSVFALPTGASSQDGIDVTGARTSQARFYLNPHLGMYLPLRPLVADQTMKLRNVGALAVGTRLGYLVTPRIALEASVSWTPSQVARSASNRTIDLDGAVTAAGVEARVLLGSLTTKTEEYTFFASGGAGVVRRSGAAWDHVSGVIHPAAIARAFILYRPIRGQIAYTAELKNFLSRSDYRSNLGTDHAGRIHHDVMITFGANLPLGR